MMSPILTRFDDPVFLYAVEYACDNIVLVELIEKSIDDLLWDKLIVSL